MSNVKRIIRPDLIVIAGLAILSVMLAACGANSEAIAAPIGLRPAAIDDLVENDNADASDVAEPALADAASPAEEQALETESNLVTAEAIVNNGQSRVADRSEHDFDPEAATEPGPAEIAGLVYMREEEKLARDVYLALYDQWGQRVFQNIAGSEQTHMDSVLMLLDQYGVSDPAAGKGLGEFDDPFFQSLYGELVVQGSQSQIEALLVGAAIEELDIVDLEERLAQTNNEYIIQVYTNLLSGSENHLRAFVSNLERQTGELYQPVYLDQDAYQAIVDGTPEQGAGNGGFRGGNGWGGNGNGRRNGQSGNA